MFTNIQNLQKEEKLKLFKMHAQAKLCKIWAESTKEKEKTITIVKLNKEFLNDFVKKDKLKLKIEERMEIMSMMCLLVDSTIPKKTKNNLLNGFKTTNPTITIFKNSFLKTIKKQEKLEGIKIIENAFNEISKENGILGQPLFKMDFLKTPINETLLKIIKTSLNKITNLIKGEKQDVNIKREKEDINIKDIKRDNKEKEENKNIFTKQQTNLEVDSQIQNENKEFVNNKALTENINKELKDKNTIIKPNLEKIIKEENQKHEERINKKIEINSIKRNSNKLKTWKEKVLKERSKEVSKNINI
ncbi:MAG TPA: hypothetical protein VLL98_06050 [Rickettsiales bacterium]|nr:hypothetical protein [Rickettsiales bacterium]